MENDERTDVNQEPYIQFSLQSSDKYLRGLCYNNALLPALKLHSSKQTAVKLSARPVTSTDGSGQALFIRNYTKLESASVDFAFTPQILPDIEVGIL